MVNSLTALILDFSLHLPAYVSLPPISAFPMWISQLGMFPPPHIHLTPKQHLRSLQTLVPFKKKTLLLIISAQQVLLTLCPTALRALHQ